MADCLGFDELLRNTQDKVSGPIYTDLDAILEKTASLGPLSDDTFNKIAQLLTKASYEREKAAFDKIACDDSGEVMTREQRRSLEKMASMALLNVTTLKHGTFIVFPEYENDQISLTSGIYLSEFEDLHSKYPYDISACVVSQDGRIAVLKKGAKFMCCATTNQSFKFQTMNIDRLSRGDHFIALNGDKVLPLSVMNGMSTRQALVDEMEYPVVKTFNFKAASEDANSPYNDWVGYSHADHQWQRGNWSVALVSNTKWERLEKKDFYERLSIQSGVSIAQIGQTIGNGFFAKDGKVLCTDPSTNVIKIKGPILHYMKSKDEFEISHHLSDLGYDRIEPEKVASFNLNTINLVCVNRDKKLYSLMVEYKDTEERLMNLRRQSWTNIGESKVRAILRILKYPGMKINELVFKSKNEPRVIAPLPKECTIEEIKRLNGGNVNNVSKETVKNIFNKYINPNNVARSIIGAAAGTMIADSVKGMATAPKANETAVKALKILGKMAEETATLGGVFEKAAVEQESVVFKDYAKAMAIGHHFSNKVAEVIQDHQNYYPRLKDVAHDIVLAKPVLEKFAYDMTGLRYQQSKTGETLISPQVLVNAVDQLNQFYKTAFAVDASIDKDMLTFNGLI